MITFLIIWSLVGTFAGFLIKAETRDWNLITCLLVGFLLGPLFWAICLIASLIGLVLAIFE